MISKTFVVTLRRRRTEIQESEHTITLTEDDVRSKFGDISEINDDAWQEAAADAALETGAAWVDQPDSVGFTQLDPEIEEA